MKDVIKNNLNLVFVTLFCFCSSTPLLAQNNRPLFETDQCIICHKENGMLPHDFNQNDVHLQEGLSCAGCHGGDPASADMEEAMSPKKGFIGAPSRTETPKFCGRCHSNIEFMRKYQPRIPTDQVEQYFTSVHGQRLEKGDQKVAECVSCHTGHGIISVKDPRSTVYPLNVPETCNRCHNDTDYMKEYSIPTDQYEKYSKSVHGIALLKNRDTGAPACNDCHGNHGAFPPGVKSIAHVCGNCHVNNMKYFSASAMGQAFEQAGFHACEQCHGNHYIKPPTDDIIGVSNESVCLNCHSEGDSGYVAAKEIHADLATFVDTLNTAHTELKQVQQKGMDDIDILFLLQEANQDLIQTRTLVHTFDPSTIETKTDEGETKVHQAILLEHKQIKEYYTRRRGLAVAILFIVLVIVGLFFKIKEIESRRKET